MKLETPEEAQTKNILLVVFSYQLTRLTANEILKNDANNGANTMHNQTITDCS